MGKIKKPRWLEKIESLRNYCDPALAAVEIGSDWIKIVQGSGVKNDKAAYRVALLKLAQIKDVATAVAESFQHLKLSKQNVVACIPRHLVTVRMLDLPATNPIEISDMLDLQVGKQTPYAKEDILYAHRIVEAGTTGYTRVMLAIVSRNIINERLSVLMKSGLTVKRVVISSEGVCDWFRETCPQDPKSSGAVLLLDVDSNFSDFIVIRGGKMVFTKNILIGANHLAQEPANWREKYSEELKRALEQFRGAEKHAEIASAFVSGSKSGLLGLNEIVNATLKVPVEVLDQLRNIHPDSLSKGPRDEDLKSVSITQLLGVIRGNTEPYMDLTPGEQKAQNVMDRKTKQLTVMGMLTVAIVTVISFLFLANIHAKTAYLAALKKTMSKIATEAEGIDKMRVVVDRIRERLDSRGCSLEFLREIYKVTPSEIFLTDVDIDEKQKSGSEGSGRAMSDVFKYVKILEATEMFENVKTTYTRVKNDKNAQFAEFEIICAYQG